MPEGLDRLDTVAFRAGDLAGPLSLRRRPQEGAALVCDALNGCWLRDPASAQLLWAEVADAIRLLNPGTQWALADAVERFWADTSVETAAQLRAVGLVRDGEPRPPARDPEHDRVLREVVDLLDATRHTFRSRQIERARALLETLLE